MERRDVGRHADGEGRKDDLELDGEGELQPGNEERIEFHRINLRTRDDALCARATFTPRQLPRDTAQARWRSFASRIATSCSLLQLNEHIFRHVCKPGFEGIVSKRLGGH